MKDLNEFFDFAKILLERIDVPPEFGDAAILVRITGGEEDRDLAIDVRERHAALVDASSIEPNVTINVKEDALFKILESPRSLPGAFLRGDFKVSGDMGLLKKIASLAKDLPKIETPF
ncbi:MAG: SCP2 sterol-binding domain-containing protein [Deltaproteobacteria bacterium]|jgi:hypothetical protein|nr:SCP2 sterol-binding domain-containing protein [Deltaproteobacteria bacterium]